MHDPEPTCWTVIEAAATGTPDSREVFARRYAGVVRASLASRWQSSPYLQELDDAVQEVFVECFKQGGVLQRAQRDRAGGFRAFLYGVIRNVALRFEKYRARATTRQACQEMDLDQIQADDQRLSAIFDKAWAIALLREAATRMAEKAQENGGPAARRVALLQLRFQEGLPIREIARRWQCDPTMLHHEYARARQEFKSALLEVLAFHHPGSPEELEQECATLVGFLS